MKLQVALDTLTLEDCLTLLEETKGSVDIAEVGTPFIIEEGMRPVREFKKHFPDIEVLDENCFHSLRYLSLLQSPGHWSVHNPFPDIKPDCSYRYRSYGHLASSRAFSS